MKNVLSLFDGMSCGQIALGRAGIDTGTYYASELDKYAITVTQSNYPNTVQLGDVTRWREWDIDWASIDLLLGGSPCQGFSFVGTGLNFKDPRSKLFFIYADILNHIKFLNPKVNFLLENVKMKQENIDVISDYLGVKPTLVNSSLVSAQNRPRYYWTSWDSDMPKDRGIVIRDILDEENTGIDGELLEVFNAKPSKDGLMRVGSADLKGHDYNRRVYSGEGKSPTLCAASGGNLEPKVFVPPNGWRKLTIPEHERLQTVPVGYIDLCSKTQAKRMLGNGWTVDVVVEKFNSLMEK